MALVFAFIVALTVGWLVARARHVKIVERLCALALIGLVVARLVFVIEYFPQYSGNIIGMFDIRDGGFSVIGGLAAAALYAGWLAWRRPSARIPLVSAIGAGALAWALTGGTSLLMESQMQGLPGAELRTITGDPVRIDILARKYPGRPVVVNLWASWCPPCRAEMPLLARAQRERPDLLFLFVDQGESFADVVSFLHTQRLELDHVLMDPQLKLGRRVLPTTLLYDAHGRLVDIQRGMFSRATLAQALDQLRTKATAVRPAPRRATASP